jgi:ubiquitin fusion degradation protein 1
MPFWMMQNIRLDQNSFVTVSSRTLKPASFIKLQPQSVDFLELDNPRIVLEQRFRHYSALTKGDFIFLRHNNKEYYLEVLEIEPMDQTKAVSIIETDVKVDFAAPIGYKEPEKPAPKTTEAPETLIDKSRLDPSQLMDESDESEEAEGKDQFKAFQGSGARISGKKVDAIALALIEKKKAEEKKQSEPKAQVITSKGEVVYKPLNELDELRKAREQRVQDKQKAMKEREEKEKEKKSPESDKKDFKPFAGAGFRLK